MRAISIRQPFAFLIVSGVKRVENRDCKGKREPSIISQARKLVGQRIAIHASRSVDNAALDALRRKDPDSADHAECLCGCVIGTAVIDRIIWHGDGDPLNNDVWRMKDRFAIVFRDVEPVLPYAAKGALGLWETR